MEQTKLAVIYYNSTGTNYQLAKWASSQTYAVVATWVKQGSQGSQ